MGKEEEEEEGEEQEEDESLRVGVSESSEAQSIQYTSSTPAPQLSFSTPAQLQFCYSNG